MSDAVGGAASESLFAGGGELGALMRSHDWSRSPLGLPEQWPQSLKTAVRIMLTSRQPMFVWWGEELTNLYNDAYKAILGGKHPDALGQPASHVWREIWDQVGPRAESAMLKNEGTYDEALLLIMERNGYPEETYYTFSYSPVPNDQGNTSGILCANSNDTSRIIGERQLLLLRDLAARTADARTFDAACTLSASCLETNPYDLPFAVIYLVDPDQQSVSLAGTCGIDRNHAAIPETVNLDSDPVWQLGDVIRTQEPTLISNLTALFDHLPTGVWQRSPHQAAVVPISPSGQTGRSGVLVVGLNPFRLFDDNYRGFINLVAAQISASIANANAYEEERKRAEALADLDRAKTTFFSNVSHEFRTPLTLMLGPLEDLLTHRSEPLPLGDREQLAIVHRNSLRLLKLVNTLLDFSRIEAGRIQAIYEPTDLPTLTAELVSVFRSAIERAGMRLIVDCSPLPELVYVDREMWEKIVLNLLSNAFKFTFEGEIAVSLRWVEEGEGNQKDAGNLTPTLSASSFIVLEVHDTGIGIPAEEVPHLFERFHQVKGAQGRSFEGSGIGLSLVQELVRLHGGTITVTSAVGKGSCFALSIPTGLTHLPQDRVNATRTLTSTASEAASFVEEALRWLPEEGSREWGMGNEELRMKNEELRMGNEDDSQFSILNSQFSSARILLADDNADMREYVKRLLGRQYEVEAVADGRAALSAVQANPPDLVLTDVMMPGMDGFELLRSLRSDPTTQEIPIILLSARAGEESRVEGLEAGANDYLIKPFSARELLAHVDATLKLTRLRKQSEEALRLSEARARLAIKVGRLGTWRYDPNTDLVELDERMREIWGESDDAVTIPLSIVMERIHPDDRERVAITVSTALNPSSLGNYDIDYRIVCPDGTERWVSSSGQVQFEGEGVNRRSLGFIGTALDITARKHAEAVREQLLAREQAAREQAETANRIKDEFLAVLSHELRSPLNPILGWSNLLRSGRLDAVKTAYAVEIIERNAKLQVQLIEDLLDVSRILRGQLSLNSVPVNLTTTIQLAMETVRLAAEAKAIDLRFEISDCRLAGSGQNSELSDPKSPSSNLQSKIHNLKFQVLGDSTRLQQVIWNLLTNSVKFTPEGGRVEVRLEQMGNGEGVREQGLGTREGSASSP